MILQNLEKVSCFIPKVFYKIQTLFFACFWCAIFLRIGAKHSPPSLVLAGPTGKNRRFKIVYDLDVNFPKICAHCHKLHRFPIMGIRSLILTSHTCNYISILLEIPQGHCGFPNFIFSECHFPKFHFSSNFKKVPHFIFKLFSKFHASVSHVSGAKSFLEVVRSTLLHLWFQRALRANIDVST